MNLSSVWNTVYPIIIAILFFELVIIIHEAGHFGAARLMKIKVNEFSVAWGRKYFRLPKGKRNIHSDGYFSEATALWRVRTRIPTTVARFLKKA